VSHGGLETRNCRKKKKQKKKRQEQKLLQQKPVREVRGKSEV